MISTEGGIVPKKRFIYFEKCPKKGWFVQLSEIEL